MLADFGPHLGCQSNFSNNIGKLRISPPSLRLLASLVPQLSGSFMIYARTGLYMAADSATSSTGRERSEDSGPKGDPYVEQQSAFTYPGHRRHEQTFWGLPCTMLSPAAPLSACLLRLCLWRKPHSQPIARFGAEFRSVEPERQIAACERRRHHNAHCAHQPSELLYFQPCVALPHCVAARFVYDAVTVECPAQADTDLPGGQACARSAHTNECLQESLLS